MATHQLETRAAIQPDISVGLRIGFWVCIFIGVAMVARRIFALQRVPGSSNAPPAMARLDAWFQTHASLTYIHILTAFVFLCVLPLIFWARTRRSTFIRRTHYCLGAAVTLTAYAMSTYSVGGWVERSAVLLFNTLFAVELGMSLRSWRAARIAEERLWTLRSTATVLGIATSRPVMGIFFATSRATLWTPPQFFGPAIWIGFSINVIAMEIWLRQHAASKEGSSQ